MYKTYNKKNKDIMNDNYWYSKVWRAIIKWGAIEKCHFIVYQKLFCILGAPILCSLTLTYPIYISLRKTHINSAYKATN